MAVCLKLSVFLHDHYPLGKIFVPSWLLSEYLRYDDAVYKATESFWSYLKSQMKHICSIWAICCKHTPIWHAFDAIQENANRPTYKLHNNNTYFLDERILSLLLSQTLSSPLKGCTHVMCTSCTNFNFGFKPLLHLHLYYVNLKPKPCEIQTREHLILV